MTFDRMLGLVSLAVFTFGALAFSILTVLYWGERRRRARRSTPTVFPWFTLVCATAFLNSVLSQLGLPMGVATVLIRNLTSCLLPLLILHLVAEGPNRRIPQWVVAVAYTAGTAAALARGLNETGLLTAPGTDALYPAPALLLGLAAIAGAALARRAWIRVLLALMALCSALNLSGFGAIAGALPDYLLLAFFGVMLYYRERLVFFDLLVKRGVFYLVGILAVALCSVAAPNIFLALLPCWLLAPWIYGRLSRAIDRVWLRRVYAPAEAERRFTGEIQGASNEGELRARAAASLGAIFHADAEVRFDDSRSSAPDDGLAAAVGRDPRVGSIVLAPRGDGVPFLSDDRRLIESLADALAMMLANVRYRSREEQLRWLASRAELKALRAQINPHFLFNALSVIAGLVHYRPDLADETIEQLAQVFRYTLRKSENEWAVLGEEVDFVTAYLRVESARFGDRLRVELAVDPAATRVPIPAMSLQPLIENAIKHGVSAMEGRGVVGLRADLDGDCVRVEVFDSGPGFPPGFTLAENGDGHGLRNVAERLRGYYGAGAQLTWQSNGDGTRVRMVLPKAGVAS